MKALVAQALANVDLGLSVVAVYMIAAACAMAAMIVFCKRWIEEVLR